MSIGEGILAKGVTEMLKKLVLAVTREISLAWGVKDDLKKLQRTIEMILAVVADAERRQVTEEAVRLWLRWLKEVVYDADDVMDEFSYETMRRSVRGNNWKCKARDFVSSDNTLAFHFQMARKIKHINQKLDAIAKDMNRFHLQTIPATDTAIPPGEGSSAQRSRQTASSVNESDIIGREDDKKKIIDMLTKVIPSSSTTSESNPERVSVVSIVGMGGLGKTTLAQLVYNDEFVKEQFDLTMWVHVSEYFDVEKLLTKVMESSIMNKFDTPSNFSVLASKVQEQLSGKRYLLVLDDLWNDKADQWEKLFSLLLVGAQGSKILITARQTRVADVVKGSIPPYKLEKLQDGECWSIIEKKAFSPGGAVKTENMAKIGLEIAKKCSGLPLAAKFLGSLMRLKNREGDWFSIQKDDVLNTTEGQIEIMPILKLSYDNLSSGLKQCFSYCSIFPKNWEMDRVTLVQLWIAEGFLDTCNVVNKRSIEDIADEYFESLMWSSFLDGGRKSLLGDIVTCKMHDLVHDLAKSVARDLELVTLKVSELNNTSKIRRLRLIQDADLSSTFLKSSSHTKKLRTVFIPECSKLDPSIFSGNKYLRILHVDRSSTNSHLKLPSLCFKLRHLRYLFLSFLDLTQVASDPSINELYNLETLILTRMRGVEMLLSNIHSLQKLRYLEVSWTDMVKLPDSITNLSNLKTLDLNHCRLKVIPDSFSGLKKLRFLNLSFSQIEELPSSITTLSNLQTLDVNTCKNLKSLPEYVAGLPKLRIFDFNNCPLLRSLPEDIGALTQIRYLNLHGTAITVLPESSANLRNLEFLHLFNCELPKDVKNWTKLRRFYHYLQNKPILGVGKLVFLEELIYTVPEKVINELEWNAGIEELGSLNFLEGLVISNLQNVKDPVDAERANLKGKQNLRLLQLIWARSGEKRELWDRHSCNFQVFEALRPPAGLRKLFISNFMGRDLPTWMCVPSVGLPNLEWLELKNCKGIEQLPASIGQLPRLNRLHLAGMSLKSLHIGGFRSLIRLVLTDMYLLEELLGYSYPFLQFLKIIGCQSLTGIPSFPSLTQLVLEKVDHKLVCSVGTSLTSLRTLGLENIDGLVYFPVSILQNNCNLQILVIKNCNQFQGFRVSDGEENDNEVALYGSLQQLGFTDCPDLKFLPDLRGWTSLQKLTIFNCPQVKEKLTYDLKSLSSVHCLFVDFIQRDQKRGDPSIIEDLVNLMNK